MRLAALDWVIETIYLSPQDGPTPHLFGDELAVWVVDTDGAVHEVRVQVVQRETPVLVTVGQLQLPPPEVRHLPHPYHQLPRQPVLAPPTWGVQ